MKLIACPRDREYPTRWVGIGSNQRNANQSYGECRKDMAKAVKPSHESSVKQEMSIGKKYEPNNGHQCEDHRQRTIKYAPDDGIADIADLILHLWQDRIIDPGDNSHR